MKKTKSYRKQYRVKKKKSILKNRFFWFIILFLILSGGIAYLVLFAPFFQVKAVEIINSDKVSTEEVKNIVENKINKKLLFFPTKSIFLVNSNEINKIILEKFPVIDSIDFKRVWLNKIYLEIKDRQPLGIWCKTETDCWYFDKEGVVFERVQDLSIQTLKIKNFNFQAEVNLRDKVINQELIGKIQKLNSKLNDDLKISIAEFVIAGVDRINVKTSPSIIVSAVEPVLDEKSTEDEKTTDKKDLEINSGNYELYFDPNSDLNWQIIELSMVLEKEIPLEKRGDLEYIDLRFSKVYYRMK